MKKIYLLPLVALTTVLVGCNLSTKPASVEENTDVNVTPVEDTVDNTVVEPVIEEPVLDETSVTTGDAGMIVVGDDGSVSVDAGSVSVDTNTGSTTVVIGE